jgi:hypothetical protein
MAEKVVIVTEPDDFSVDGFRLLTVNLSSEQNSIVSQSLLNLNSPDTIIVYAWNSSNSASWLLDKKHKADLIIFNADSDNEIVVGYMAAQKNSYYFGNLKFLSGINVSAIYSVEDCESIIEKNLKLYGK